MIYIKIRKKETIPTSLFVDSLEKSWQIKLRIRIAVCLHC